MQIVRLICDRCYVEEQEDDAAGWTQTKDGRDLCQACRFPFRKSADPSPNAADSASDQAGSTGTGNQPDGGQ